MNRHRVRSLTFLAFWLVVCFTAFGLQLHLEDLPRMASGLTWLEFAGLISGVLALIGFFNAITHLVLAHRHKPAVEGVMIGRLYWLLGFVAVLLCISYGFGVLKTFGTVFSLFGGMLLGWSLQAPVSGFAAYLLVSIKRPFRPGDRVQFPNLGLTGDIKDIGAMYTVLDQVGGAIGSEEAVGRYILVPNAMLFTQVVINYTVSQDAAYMLDEIVIRITFDSDWAAAERILLKAANEVTKDIIQATGVKPYIRADPYDYGVYLRLRYRTRVQDRVEISYRINKLIFEEIQQTPAVDLAIPFIYSYRSGQDRKEDAAHDKDTQSVAYVPVDRIRVEPRRLEPHDVEQLTHSIRKDGLLQPIIVVKSATAGDYELLAGHLRLEACKKLGWKAIPAMVRGSEGDGDFAVRGCMQ